MEREIISPRKGEGKLHLQDYSITIKSIIRIATRSQQNITLWACGHWAYLWTMGISLNYKLSSDNNDLREPKKENLKNILIISQHEKFLIAVVRWQYVWPVDWIGGILISLDWYSRKKDVFPASCIYEMKIIKIIHFSVPLCVYMDVSAL